MNNKGQYAIYTLMIAVVVIILALSFASPIKQFVTDARNSTTETQVGLDCGNSSISDYDKATCVVADLYIPYYVLGVVGLALIIIGTYKVVNNNE